MREHRIVELRFGLPDGSPIFVYFGLKEKQSCDRIFINKFERIEE